MSDIVNAIGANQLWGFVPSLDLGDGTDFREESDLFDSDEEIRILLFSPGDIGHILRTLASSRKWSGKKKLKFFIYESEVECLTRHLLFLSLLSEKSYSSKFRAQVFLEIYGNMKIQSRTSNLLIDKCSDLLGFFEEKEPFTKMWGEIFDLSYLKYKERDFIEETLKFWKCSTTECKYNVEKLWDYRLRHYYGDRFDSRTNLIDWDYSMKMKATKNFDIIHFLQYSTWRMDGIGFKLRDCEYVNCNPTWLTKRMGNDVKGPLKVFGYWSDIIITPFISFGVESTNKELFKIVNRHRVHSTVDVCEHNIISYLDSIESNFLKEKSVQIRKDVEIETKDDENVNRKESATGPDKNSEWMKTKMVFLTGNVDQLLRKAKFRNCFQRIYISASFLHLIREDLSTNCSEKCFVSVETPKYFPISKEQKDSYIQKVTNMAKEAKWDIIESKCTEMLSSLSFIISKEK